MSTFATATNDATLLGASNAIAAACNFEAVPKPPVSFDAISACVNTVMLTLNGTSYPATA